MDLALLCWRSTSPVKSTGFPKPLLIVSSAVFAFRFTEDVSSIFHTDVQLSSVMGWGRDGFMGGKAGDSSVSVQLPFGLDRWLPTKPLQAPEE